MPGQRAVFLDRDGVINQAIVRDGKPYPPSMIDTTTIKMGRVLGYVRAKEGYERLVNTAIYNDLAKAQIIKKLTPYLRNSSEVSPWRECDDLATLHKRFQFQRVWVDGTIEQKFSLFLRELSRGTPDDTTGALGSFNFYAAIAKATIDRDSGKVTVTHISVYVKDNYTFNTDPGEASQYLGHSPRPLIELPAKVRTSPLSRSVIHTSVSTRTPTPTSSAACAARSPTSTRCRKRQPSSCTPAM